MPVKSPQFKLGKIFLFACASAVTLAVIGVLAVGAAYLYYSPTLPDPMNLQNPQFSEPLRVYSADGQLIGEYGVKRRWPLTYEQIPKRVVQAFVAAEDDRFFEHHGVDVEGILRAALNLVLTGNKSQGGSTITMQLARNLYLSPRRTYVRKFKEIILALRLESRYSKQQILQTYLNKIYLGSSAYGIGAASRVYYGKPLDQLDLAQIATLAGLPKAPSSDNPIASPKRAKVRRDYVLGRMLSLGDITQAEYAGAKARPVQVAKGHDRDKRAQAGYVSEMVRQVMYKRHGKKAYTHGYKVYTTINSEHQQAARQALRRALLAYDQRHAWHGPEAQLDASTLRDQQALDAALAQRGVVGGLIPAVALSVQDRSAVVYTTKYGKVSLQAGDMPWLGDDDSVSELFKRGDVIRLVYTGDKQSKWQLAEIPKVEGALVAINPDTGAIKALVGGFDFGLTQFNRAIQARRQTGSAFKPFVYSAALANGFTPATIINDAPVVFGDPGSGDQWRPSNYAGEINGPTRVREGLVHSLNLVTIRLLDLVGISTARNYMQRFGLPKSHMPRDLTLALGSGTFSPLQIARGYAVFANGGHLIKPYFISRIVADNGDVLFRAKPERVCHKNTQSAVCQQADYPRAPRAVTPQNAYLMNSMLQDVIQHGTGQQALRLHRSDLAGKTGTTDDQTNAWFAGYNRALVTVCWVGFDTPAPLGAGETGAHAALPMWIDFMGSALQGVPEKSMPRPAGMVTVRIDADTGKLASPASQHTLLETFRVGNVPKQEQTPASTNDTGTSHAVQQLF